MATSAQLAHPHTEPWPQPQSPLTAMAPRLWGAKRGKAGIALLGLAGLIFGGFPYWAARRILYPVNPAMPAVIPDHLDTEIPGVEAEYAEFPTRDGGKLGGWFIPAPASASEPAPCIMLVYGYGGFKEQMIYYAQIVHEAGFSSFMFDMQGSGLRRGKPVTLGYKEKWDLMDAINYVRTRPEVDGEHLGVLGVSMGAATALLAAEDDPHIKSIVADSSYANMVDMIKPGLRAFVGSPATIVAPMIVWFAENMMGVKASDITPETSAHKLGRTPVFIIHGANDQLTDPHSAQRIYDALSGPKELWVVANCGHARAPEVEPEEYRRRVNEFFKRTLAA
ncbi:MAG: alpha/beta fold hydrolase [Chloroflexia bacterium]